MMKMKKMISALLLTSLISSTCFIEVKAESINLNNKSVNSNKTVIKSEEFNYKDASDISIETEFLSENIGYGKNTIALCSYNEDNTSSIITLDNKYFETTNSITFEGVVTYFTEVDGGYLVFVLEDTEFYYNLHMYKISEDCNILYDKEIIDGMRSNTSSTRLISIPYIKLLDNENIIIFTEETKELVISSIKGDILSRVNITGPISNIEILYTIDFFDTGENYIIIGSDFSGDFIAKVSYDGTCQSVNYLPSEIETYYVVRSSENTNIAMTMSFEDEGENSYIAGTTELIEFNDEGTIIKRNTLSDSIYTTLDIYKNNIYMSGLGVESYNPMIIQGIISNFDYNFNNISDYIINSETLGEDCTNYMIQIGLGKLNQDRLFVGCLAFVNMDNMEEKYMLFSVDLDEVDIVDVIDKAIANPSVENIKVARELVNNMEESDKKEELQNRLNEINISLDLEKNSATSNLDIYIKSENMLSMNLSTNSITFNDYSGLNEIEQQNTVEISINSSLPYQLNAYLLDEMYNNDRTKKIDMDRLQIKDNTEDNYSEFVDINEKLVLKDSCESGNDKSHSIDLKLKGGNAYESDIYKTVIKFEAQQK